MSRSIVLHSSMADDPLSFIKIAGILRSHAPGCEVVDANSYFEKDNVRQLSAYLFTTVPFWPSGTVFLSNIGKGKGILTEFNNGTFLISPDNGTATMTVDNFGYKRAFLLAPEFAGKDGLALAAAELASGKKPEEIGTLMTESIQLFRIPEARIEDGLAVGEVGMLLKTFGNITFTIKTDDFEKTKIQIDDMVHVTFTHHEETVWERTVPYEPSFGYVEVGEAVVFNGSSGYMDIGLNQRSFIEECIPEILKEEDIGSYKVRIERVGR